MAMTGQPSVVPFRPTDTRDISLKRRTITGTIVKEIFFKVKSRTAPRSAQRPLGVRSPSVDECFDCIPQSDYPIWRVMWNTITCGWFYMSTVDNANDGMSGLYEQIALLAALFALIVKSCVSDAKEINDTHLRGLCVLFGSLSLFFLVSSSFYSMAHIVLTKKMKLESQVVVFNQLYFAPFVKVFSPIRFLQYGIHTGGMSGILWVCGFVEKAYSITFIVLFCFLMLGTWLGFLRLVYAALGVLSSEPLREGEHASLDESAIKILLESYEEDCGAEFMSPQGFATFCGECLLKPGCDPTQLCDFSYITQKRMNRLLEDHLNELANASGSFGDDDSSPRAEEADATSIGTLIAGSVLGKTNEDPKSLIKSALKSGDEASTNLSKRGPSPIRQLVEEREQARKNSKVQSTRRKVRTASGVRFSGQDQPLVDFDGESSAAEVTEESTIAPVTLDIPLATTHGHHMSSGHNSEIDTHLSPDRSSSKSPVRSSLQAQNHSNGRSSLLAPPQPTNVRSSFSAQPPPTNDRSSLSAQLPPTNV